MSKKRNKRPIAKSKPQVRPKAKASDAMDKFFRFLIENRKILPMAADEEFKP